MEHHSETPLGVVVCTCPYHLPKNRKNVVHDDLKAMLHMAVVNESHGGWSSPVPKADRSVCFCFVWTSEVNAVPKFDAYPVQYLDELLKCG